jgi:hypothetical protein
LHPSSPLEEEAARTFAPARKYPIIVLCAVGFS